MLVTAAVNERDPDEQRRLTTLVIETLIEMRAPGDEAEEARVLLAHLDSKALILLVDEHGRMAHSEAVETLLSLGFPHALQVSPDDLQQYRINEDSVGAQVLTKAERWHDAKRVVVAALLTGGLGALLARSWMGFAAGAGFVAFLALTAVLPSSDQ